MQTRGSGRAWAAGWLLVPLVACGESSDPTSSSTASTDPGGAEATPGSVNAAGREARQGGRERPRDRSRSATVLMESPHVVSRKLKEHASRHELELDLQVRPSMIEQLEVLDDRTRDPVARMLYMPLVPNALQRAIILTRQAKVPLIALDRGANTAVSWVGIPVTSRAADLAGRASDLLPDGLEVPRVVVIEDATWVESSERVNAWIQRMTDRFSHVEVVTRIRVRGFQPDDVRKHAYNVANLQPIHLLVSGGSEETELAFAIRDRLKLDSELPVLGLSRHAATVERATAEPQTNAILAYRTEDLIREAIAMSVEGTDAVERVEVASWIAGVEEAR